MPTPETISARFKPSDSGPGVFVRLVLGLLTAVGPVSTDIYLPAFPDMERSFHSAPGSAQITLSAWFIGLAVGQIVSGVLSDRYGRRGVMLVGALVFTLASLGCALTSQLWLFSLFRLIAALGGSACLVIPSACVRDWVSGDKAARIMSQLVLIMGVVPILAPALGGVMLHYASWESIFWASTVYGAVCIGLIYFFIPETLAPQNRSSIAPVVLLERYVILLRSRNFTVHAFIGGFCAFVSFIYLSSAPTVFITLFGFSQVHFGVMFGVFAIGMIGAAQLNGVLVGHMRFERILGWSVVTAVVGAMLLVFIAIAGALLHLPMHGAAIIPFILALMLILSTTGMISPNAMVGALADHPMVAGSAAAFIGTLQYSLGAVAGYIVGLLHWHSLIPMASTMLAGTLIMLALVMMRPRSP